MKHLFTLLLLSLAGNAVQAADAEAIGERLQARWFETEVIIFEYPGVGEEFEGETLTTDKPRHFPGNMIQLQNTPYPFPLEPDTADDAYDFRMGRGEQALVVEPYEEPQVIIRRIAEEAEEAEGKDGPLDTAASSFEELSGEIEPSPQEVLDQALAEFEASLYDKALKLQETLTLDEPVARLTWQDRHRILFHQRWLQPVPPRGEPLPVLVQTGPVTDDLHELEGTLALTVGRYLHLRATLWLQEWAHAPQPQAEPPDPPNFPDSADGDASEALAQENALAPPAAAPERRYVAIDESRRMRSGEMHYIDHPRFGVLVRVDPVAIPEHLILALEALENADD